MMTFGRTIAAWVAFLMAAGGTWARATTIPFSYEEPLKRAWSGEVLSFEVKVPVAECDTAAMYVTDEDGKVVPAQVSDVRFQAERQRIPLTVTLRTDFQPWQKRTWLLHTGERIPAGDSRNRHGGGRGAGRLRCCLTAGSPWRVAGDAQDVPDGRGGVRRPLADPGRPRTGGAMVGPGLAGEPATGDRLQRRADPRRPGAQAGAGRLRLRGRALRVYHHAPRR